MGAFCNRCILSATSFKQHLKSATSSTNNNEYLDMKQAPLFGWGSNEVGTKGLLIRLGVVYAVVFAAV